MRRPAAIALLLMAAACGQQKPPQPGPQGAQRNTPTSPVLLRYLPPDRGGPSAFPEAKVNGVLDLSGPCVRLQDARVQMWIVVGSPGPHLGQDYAGLYIQSGRERLRHGSSVMGGGGWFDIFPGGLGRLDRPIPEACRSGPFVVVTGMARYDPAGQPPPKSPPPPPN